MPNLPLLEMAISALGGGGLAKAADIVFGRKAREVTALGATVSALADQLDRADTRQKRTDARVDDMEEKHADCERSLRDVNHRLDETERERTALKAEISRLMGGEIAPPYTHIDRPAPKKKSPRG